MPQKLRERTSESQGGKPLMIREMILRGARSRDELKERSGLSRKSIRSALRTLGGWGVDVSQFFTTARKNREKIEQLIKEEDDEKIKQILDELPVIVILKNLVKERLRRKQKRNGIFITIGDLTSGVFHYKNTETGLFFDSLRLSEVPIRRAEYGATKTGKVLVYYVLLERHRERALGVLEKDPSLQKYKENPIKIICGQSTDPIPNTNQLENSGHFRYVGSLFKEMGIPINSKRTSKLHYSNFLTPKCPIPVYQYQCSSRRSYYFPKKYAGALKNFLRNRYAGLFRIRVIDK